MGDGKPYSGVHGFSMDPSMNDGTDDDRQLLDHDASLQEDHQPTNPDDLYRPDTDGSGGEDEPEVESSAESGEVTNTAEDNSQEDELPERRDKDSGSLEDRVAVFFGCIPPHVRVKEVKEKIEARGLKTTYIRWMGVRGYCIAYFAKTDGLTNEIAANKLRGIRVGRNDKRLNIEPDNRPSDFRFKVQQDTSFRNRGTSEDDKMMTYRPTNLTWKARVFQADTQCRVFVGSIPMNCRAKELREACEAKGCVPAEIDASKSQIGFALIMFDREEGLNSNILCDKLNPLTIRDGTVTIHVQPDKQSSREEDRPPGAPDPNADKPLEEEYDRDEETPDHHRVWVGFLPYGVTLREFKKEVSGKGLEPDRYVWKTSHGIVVLLFKKEGEHTMEDLVRKLWGIRVGSKKRNLTVKPDGEDPEGIEEKIREENRSKSGYPDGFRYNSTRGGRITFKDKLRLEYYDRELRLQREQDTLKQRNSDIYGAPGAQYRVHPLIPSVRVPVPTPPKLRPFPSPGLYCPVQLQSPTISPQSPSGNLDSVSHVEEQKPVKRTYKPRGVEDELPIKKTYQPRGFSQQSSDDDGDEDGGPTTLGVPSSTEKKDKKDYFSWFPQATRLGPVKKK